MSPLGSRILPYSGNFDIEIALQNFQSTFDQAAGRCLILERAKYLKSTVPPFNSGMDSVFCLPKKLVDLNADLVRL